MPIRVYSQELYGDLAKASADAAAEVEFRRTLATAGRPHSMTSTRSAHSSAQSRLGTTQKMTQAQSRAAQSRARQLRLGKVHAEAEAQLAEGLRKNKEKAQRRREAQERKFERMLMSIDKEGEVVGMVDEYLSLRDSADNRSKRQLHQEWTKKVFNPLQKEIQSHLESVPTSELELRRREAFEEYIKVGNTKEGVFRDIIIPDDYDPFKHKKNEFKYSKTKYDNRDPLHKDNQKHARESGLIDALNPNAHHIRPQARESLDILLWDKLDSTPYARYADTENEVLHTRPVPGQRPRNESTLVIDQYNLDTRKELVKEQFFPGGKIVPPYKARPDNILVHNDQPYIEKVKISKQPTGFAR